METMNKGGANELKRRIESYWKDDADRFMNYGRHLEIWIEREGTYRNAPFVIRSNIVDGYPTEAASVPPARAPTTGELWFGAGRFRRH